MDVDTSLLRAVVALSEELHFGRSAARLGITQQALSKRIQRLEDQLGAALVDRTDRRRIRLTAAGQRVVSLSREALALLDRLDPAQDRPAGRLRVDVMGEGLAPSTWLRRAAQQTPLPLDAVHRSSEATAEHLVRTGAADIAFGRAGAVPSPWPDAVAHRLVRLEPVAVLVPARHPWANVEQLPLAALARQSLWFPMAAAPVEWRSYVADLRAVAGFDLDVTGSTFGYRQWAHDVASGAAAPSLIGEAMLTPTPGMRTVPLVDPTPVFPWSVVWARTLAEETLDEVLRGMGLAETPRRDEGIWMPDDDAQLLAATT
ncbi:DNA-binding transcriptional regulator, LysR family [Quadrisphaera granulorum]|uniref:DNA-binding transcriptional LysR family regulator n=1 Tax=Quadrisphaera granulorum TaxID=317664 RepID=A0A315ZS84_9ACTN|nr:LysR family transcriptional regulator [Quadrisphaera granulorum]PWJ47738.1 DNA-binding transcriptional LysR family regulator [Quadrisphaera granulorum]SZE98692.1 DNA-binding transcriptional regulator, LysR family [Quadrisphaera granulorum]